MTKTTLNESKLSYRLGRLAREQRRALLNDLGIADRTLDRWMERPSQLIPWDSLRMIKRHLDQIDSCDYDMAEMMKPVELQARA